MIPSTVSSTPSDGRIRSPLTTMRKTLAGLFDRHALERLEQGLTVGEVAEHRRAPSRRRRDVRPTRLLSALRERRRRGLQDRRAHARAKRCLSLRHYCLISSLV